MDGRDDESLGQRAEMLGSGVSEDFASCLLVADHVRIRPHRQGTCDVLGASAAPPMGYFIAQVDGRKTRLDEVTHQVALIETRHGSARVASFAPVVQHLTARRFQVGQVNIREDPVMTVDRLEQRHSAAGTKNAMKLRSGAGLVDDIDQHGANHHRVNARVGQWQRNCVTNHRVEPVSRWQQPSALGQCVIRNVQREHAA